jgi:hypothetical protein
VGGAKGGGEKFLCSDLSRENGELEWGARSRYDDLRMQEVSRVVVCRCVTHAPYARSTVPVLLIYAKCGGVPHIAIAFGIAKVKKIVA